MINFNEKNWLNYFRHFIHESLTLLKKPTSLVACRIIGWKKSNDCIAGLIHVQIIGKNIATYYSPLQIVNDNEMLSLFSPIDARTITILAMAAKQGNNPRYKIILTDFMSSLGQDALVIHDRLTAKQFQRSIDQLSQDFATIDKLSSRDAYKIGISVGERNILKEEEIYNMFKKQKKSD